MWCFLRLYVRNFWSHEKRLPPATLERLLRVLSSLYSTRIEERFLSLATDLLLEMTSQSPDYTRNIFEFPLSECKFLVCFWLYLMCTGLYFVHCCFNATWPLCHGLFIFMFSPGLHNWLKLATEEHSAHPNVHGDPGDPGSRHTAARQCRNAASRYEGPDPGHPGLFGVLPDSGSWCRCFSLQFHLLVKFKVCFFSVTQASWFCVVVVTQFWVVVTLVLCNNTQTGMFLILKSFSSVFQPNLYTSVYFLLTVENYRHFFFFFTKTHFSLPKKHF